MPFDFGSELAAAVSRARATLNSGTRGELFDPEDDRARAYLDISAVLRQQYISTQPFATTENRQRELMFADLISGPLAGIHFSFHQTDPQTGKRTVQKVGAEAGAKLKEALESALGKA